MIVYSLILYIVLVFVLSLPSVKNHIQRKPNIVILLADDVGIGDIGCYGNKTIRTPNIDRICSQGVKLNHNLAAGSVCTPSRAAFLTGRYPIRFGYVSHNISERRVTVTTTASGGLPPNETTFVEILKQQGYRTGLFGKWHLGLHCEEEEFCHSPLRNGFDYFYGIPLTNLMDCGPWSLASLQSELVAIPNLTRFYLSVIVLCYTYLFVKTKHKVFFLFLLLGFISWYFQNIFLFFLHRQLNCVLMRNHRIVEQPYNLETLSDKIVGEAKLYIERNRATPFLAYVSFHQAHAALLTHKRFAGRSRHGSYGDTMQEMDSGVGEIIAELDKQGILNNTIIYFSSDHGPALGMVDEATGEHVGGWRGIYRGGKGSSYEGGIRVPTIVQWSGVIPANITFDVPTSHLDLYPTLLSLIDSPLDTLSSLDGVDISKILLGGGRLVGDRSFFHYCGSNLHAVTLAYRDEIWKVHFVVPKYETGVKHCFGSDVVVLAEPIIYDLIRNPSEDSPVVANPVYDRVLTRARRAVRKHQGTLDLPVPSQLSRKKNSFSLKRMHCCNYPFCYC